MRNILHLAIISVLIAALSGCVTVKKVVRERVDQNLSGNRGYIKGEGSAEPSKVSKRTREYIDIKVEIPTWNEIKGTAEKETAAEPTTAELESEPGRGYVQEPIEEIEEPIAVKKAEPTLYKVKEGDSLSLIAKKFYGKASEWTLIYEANMDKIKDPERLKAGTELVIPDIEEKTQYIK